MVDDFWRRACIERIHSARYTLGTPQPKLSMKNTGQERQEIYRTLAAACRTAERPFLSLLAFGLSLQNTQLAQKKPVFGL